MRKTVVLAAILVLLPISAQAGEAITPFSSWGHFLEEIWEAIWDSFDMEDAESASPVDVAPGLDEIQSVSGNLGPNVIPVGLVKPTGEDAALTPEDEDSNPNS